MQERLGGRIFRETKPVAATRPFFCERTALRNGFVSGVALPRNESQQVRPAGTRVALPGANRRSSQSESSVQDSFSGLRKRGSWPADFRNELFCEKTLWCFNRDYAAVEIPTIISILPYK
jgi:hypothetical protein